MPVPIIAFALAVAATGSATGGLSVRRYNNTAFAGAGSEPGAVSPSLEGIPADLYVRCRMHSPPLTPPHTHTHTPWFEIRQPT